MEQPLLRLQDLSKYYTTNQSVVVGVNTVNLSFSRGEFVAVTGESGSGKSTLSHVVGGILPYESGELYINGKPTSHYDSADWERYRRDNISFISQNYGILPGATVLSNVITALRLSGMEKKAAKEAAREILEQVELWDLRRRRAAKLSSGQKQRLSIARALAKPAPILIADEPTGNLDGENSAKVISLLARAAQSRLVILVTHEFSEAQAHVTRHIQLRDGRVVMDVPVNPQMEPQPLAVPARRSRSPLSTYVASVQQLSRPIWSALMALIFALAAFAVFAFLGTFILNLDDTATRIYDDDAFRNGDMQRIVVSRTDGAALTDSDFEKLTGTGYVTQVERYGHVTDVYYAYREGEDYRVINTENYDPSSGTIWFSTSYRVNATAPFMKTVPLMASGQQFLTEGRLPESFYEVVSADDSLNIGDSVKVFLYDANRWNTQQLLQLDFTVVGKTGHGEGLYFSEDIGRFFIQFALVNFSEAVFIPNGELTDTQCRVSSELWQNIMKRYEGSPVQAGFFNLNLTDGEIPSIYDTPHLMLELGENAVHAHDFYRLAEVSYRNFDLLTWSRGSDQASLTITDYGYTDRVLEQLQHSGFVALSPYQQGSNRIDPEKAAQREQTLTVCLGAMAALVALQVILLRAMFTAQTESYRLLSNIGLTAGTARLSVLWQILRFTVLGQLLGAALIWLCVQKGVQRILNVVYYLPVRYVALLCAVHLAISLLAAAWISHALGKQVFPLAGKYSDISLDDEEAAV